mgnify:CR=1 FL=1
MVVSAAMSAGIPGKMMSAGLEPGTIPCPPQQLQASGCMAQTATLQQQQQQQQQQQELLQVLLSSSSGLGPVEGAGMPTNTPTPQAPTHLDNTNFSNHTPEPPKKNSFQARSTFTTKPLPAYTVATQPRDWV